MTARVGALLLLLALLAGSPALAQSPQVELELGVAGAVVEGAWNPLRVVVRDIPSAVLTLSFDQGTLRGGPLPYDYTARISGPGGVSVYEDDVWVPGWRSLTWTVASSDRVVASGSFDARGRDDRPLTLLLTSAPGNWLALLPPDARPQDVSAGGLPERAAAYSGVKALIVDGTTAAPRLESLVAAAAAGVDVYLVRPLPSSHSHLDGLVVEGPMSLGAGRVWSVGRDELPDLLSTDRDFSLGQAVAAFTEVVQADSAQHPNRMTVLVAGGIYALLAMVLVRFGGTAGVLAALLVGALGAGAAWMNYRPADPLQAEERSLFVSAGGIGVEVPLLSLHSLPGGEVSVAGQLRLTWPYPHRVSRASTELVMSRWQRELLLGKPVLMTPALLHDGSTLRNAGGMTLTHLVASGLGYQAQELLPGTSLTLTLAEDAPAPAPISRMLGSVPAGSALALSGNDLHVALGPGPGGGS